MAETVRIPPATSLTELARTVLVASEQVGDAWWSAQRDLGRSMPSLGGGVVAQALREAHHALVDEAGVTIGRHVAVLEADVDRLYQTASQIARNEERSTARARG
jgi:hypothetical protein